MFKRTLYNLVSKNTRCWRNTLRKRARKKAIRSKECPFDPEKQSRRSMFDRDRPMQYHNGRNL